MTGRLWFSSVGGEPIGRTPDGSPVFADQHGVETATELTDYVTDVRLGARPTTEKENNMPTTIRRDAQDPKVGFTLTDLEAFVTALQDAGLPPDTPITAAGVADGVLLALAVTA